MSLPHLTTIEAIRACVPKPTTIDGAHIKREVIYADEPPNAPPSAPPEMLPPLTHPVETPVARDSLSHELLTLAWARREVHMAQVEAEFQRHARYVVEALCPATSLDAIWRIGVAQPSSATGGLQFSVLVWP